MHETDAVAEARRDIEICNACRYCEGFCAVFPAMELRREFSAGDLSYLANLCHNCRGCYYACQYAPPHEWGINVPGDAGRGARGKLRRIRLAEAAGVGFRAQRHAAVAGRRAGHRAGAGRSACWRTGRADSSRPATGRSTTSSRCGRCRPSASPRFGFSLVALAMGARNFWRDAGPRGRIGPVAVGDRAVGRADAEEPRRRRQRLQRQFRGVLDAPPLAASRDVLRLPAVLRRDDDGVRLSRVPGLAGALSAAQRAGAAWHRRRRC